MIYDRNQEDEIFSSLLDSQGSDARSANQLIGVFERGYPKEKMQYLLSSSNVDLQRAGAFIVAELGTKRLDLAELLVPFIGHQDNWINHYAMEKTWIAKLPLSPENISQLEQIANFENETLRRDAIRLLDSLK